MSEPADLLGYQPKSSLIAGLVREEIMRGRFKRGDKLLPDDELASKYGVNKRTVAAGLNTLAAEGLLERAPRRGTIVTHDISGNRSGAVGMIMMGGGHVYGDLNRKISRRLAERGLYPALIDDSVVYEPKCVETFLERMSSEKQCPYGYIIDGDLRFPYEYVKANTARMENMVFIIRRHHPEPIPGAKEVLVDFAEAGRLAARHFIQSGRKKPVCLAVHERNYAGPWSSVQVMIMQGFAEACKEAGVEFDDTVFWKLLRGAPFDETVTACFKAKRRPDACFCYPDSNIRYKILPLLESLEISCPGEIDLTGFYNTPHAAECGFSSVSIREPEIARRAVEMLSGDADETNALIHPGLVIRNAKGAAHEIHEHFA
jgi:DNA-binding LacI/PurR family transcriptional regulator